MYNYGGNMCGGVPYQPYPTCGGTGSNYAIVLVLFILLVIVIGSRWAR